jgi:hypothetical protein
MRAALALAALAAFVPAAHAGENLVVSNYALVRLLPPPGVGGGAPTNVVAVECDANAITASVRDVAIATSVGCSVADLELRAVAPGPNAATASIGVFGPTVTVCSWAEATFYNSVTHQFSTAVDPPYCVVVEL